MSYLPHYADLGAVVQLAAGGDASVARLQSAINRVILGMRNDRAPFVVDGVSVPDFRVDIARSTAAPIAITGRADQATLNAAKAAGLIAGASTIEVTNAAFTEKLESFADSRGYPPGDTISELVLGLPVPGVNVAGIRLSGKTVAIAGGAALLLGAFFLLRRRAA